jgi:hypothetical protein
VRSIDCSYPGQYLITAGPADDTSNPPAAPLDFRLFRWSGNPANAPVERAATFASGYGPEGCILPASPIVGSTVAQFINDDGGNTCWRSTTVTVGPAADPLDVPLAPGTAGRLRFSSPPAPNPARGVVSFAITVPGEQWADVAIHDVEGRRLATLWRGVLAEGDHRFSWNPAALGKAREPAGLYWVRVRAGGASEAKSFTLIR